MRFQRAFLPGTLAILLLIALLVPIVGQNNPSQSTAPRSFADADWPRYTGDLAGTRYSRLKQINTANVARLTSAWTFAGVGGEETPIVVNGILYASTSTGVIALDGDTGKEVWRYGAVPVPGAGGRGGRGGGQQGDGGRGAIPPPPAAGGQAAAGARGAGGVGGDGGARGGGGGAPSSRGVAYFPGDATHPARILVMVGRRLLALNAANGKPDATFGSEGFVDTGVNWGGVPLVYKNVVVLGAANGEVTQGDSPGDTRAYDARSGDKLWSFTTVAQPGDPNHAAAWLDDGWTKREG